MYARSWMSSRSGSSWRCGVISSNSGVMRSCRLLLERVEQGVPGERRTLDPDRELDDAGECLEISELHVLVELARVVRHDEVVVRQGHHPLEAAHQRAHLGDRLALDRLAH